MNRFDGYFSVSLLRRGGLRSILVAARHDGSLQSFTEDKKLFRSKFYLTGATEKVWLDIMGSDRFGLMLMVMNQMQAVSPYNIGLGNDVG